MRCGIGSKTDILNFPVLEIIRESDFNLMVAGSSEGSIIVNQSHLVVIDKAGTVTNSVEASGKGLNHVKQFLRWYRRARRLKPIDKMTAVTYDVDYEHLSKFVKLAQFDPIAAYPRSVGTGTE